VAWLPRTGGRRLVSAGMDGTVQVLPLLSVTTVGSYQLQVLVKRALTLHRPRSCTR